MTSWQVVMQHLLDHEGAERFSEGLREQAEALVAGKEPATPTMIDDVAEFNEKFGLPFNGQDIIFGDDIQAGLDALLYRLKFLREETEEFNEAFSESDRVKAFDAMLDLAYVALGTALFMGVTPAQWCAGWAAVHAANMRKTRVAKADLSKRGSGFDVVKPAGWTGPEDQLKEILAWNQPAGD